MEGNTDIYNDASSQIEEMRKRTKSDRQAAEHYSGDGADALNKLLDEIEYKLTEAEQMLAGLIIEKQRKTMDIENESR